MKEWHLRQKIFHDISADEDIGDSLKNKSIVEEYEAPLIIKRALEYIHVQSDVYFYPGKTYAVATTYALLLRKHFNEDLYQSLNDPRLLYHNDPYFVPYNKSKELYDLLLSRYPEDALSKPTSYSLNFQKTLDYFYLEFLLDAKTAVYAPPA